MNFHLNFYIRKMYLRLFPPFQQLKSVPWCNHSNEPNVLAIVLDMRENVVRLLGKQIQTKLDVDQFRAIFEQMLSVQIGKARQQHTQRTHVPESYQNVNQLRIG